MTRPVVNFSTKITLTAGTWVYLLHDGKYCAVVPVTKPGTYMIDKTHTNVDTGRVSYIKKCRTSRTHNHITYDSWAVWASDL